MNRNHNDFRDRYSSMETEELIALFQTQEITEIARPYLEAELGARGITTEAAATAKIEPEYREGPGFQWWVGWAWLGLTVGNLYTLGVLRDAVSFAVGLVVINSLLMIMILKFNKYAFLIATIISLNPLLWIINGVYLKRRWHHPKVNHLAAPASVK